VEHSHPHRIQSCCAQYSPNYGIGFPFPGRWVEAFNSDVYDHCVNPQVAGNGGQIFADGPPMHRFSYSAGVVIPANGVVVFTRS
jgi:1,4-alpha-glucan branching enzyme